MADSGKDLKESDFFTCIWTVENMSTPCVVYSPTFTVQGIDKTKWNLGIICIFSDSMELRITRKDDYDRSDVIDTNCEFSFLGTNGLPLNKKLSKKQFRNNGVLRFHEFANQDDVFNLNRAELIPNDTLTVRCRMRRKGTEISKPELFYGRTNLRMERGAFVWAIREFSSLQAGQERMILFNPTAKEEFQWKLICFIREEDDEQYLSLKILTKHIDAKENALCWYKAKVFLLNVKREIVRSKENALLKFDDFFKIRDLMNDKASLLPNDVLSIKCEFELLTKVWSRIESYRSSELEDSMAEMNKKNMTEQNETSAFTEAMKGLLLKGSLSDVNLRAGSKSFAAHKCILSARSPVFEAMFNGDMQEKTGKCVEIPDIEEDTMRRLLSYIYTDSVEELQWPGAAELYRAADKYELLDLKRICSTFLKSNVTINNVCSVLVLGDMHHDQDLREEAQDFIMKQDAEFFTSKTWRSFKEEYSKLALETMERIVLNIKGYF